ncbi:sigma-70 family RNA polymerase sigma factor [Paralimibaculum aggregatum]|uniref:sigma-70 family RNA polymerase sigma factor n=1 Tax=Paralimibaculum aggregatum TaxID=3036245 RepID=UPI0025560098|nr:sigma-70 family RNA polymerase sigma factor [Limibaculum sp. NKW23]
MNQEHDPPPAAGNGPDWADAADEALLAAIAAGGDRAAFVALFGRYAGRIKAFLLRGGTAETVAEEAAQEVMILLWRRAGQFDPARARAATWIFTIARNKRVDLIRREARGRPDPDEPLLQSEPVPPPERGIAGAERDAQVRAAIEDLTPEQRDVVRRAFFSEQSHSEIAGDLGLPLGTVKSRLRLAFQHLRGTLGPAFSMELIDD